MTAHVSASPIEARGLVKRYGRITAVDHVDLTVQAGDVYGYLGPNGAGKTTSLRMLLGLIRPDEGSARLFGRDPLAEGARALDGVAGFVEAPRFYPYLTGRRNLEHVAALDGDGAAGRIDAALDTVDLADRARDKVGGYSHGMRQRLGIAGALLRDPQLLLLDEPTTGLDPAGMRDMRRLVRRLADQGMTVLLSSHLMGEVEELCDRVAIVRSGRVVYEGSLDDLIATTAGHLRAAHHRRRAGPPHRRGPARRLRRRPRRPRGDLRGRRRAGGGGALARARRGRGRDQRARAAHGDARGALLPHDRGRGRPRRRARVARPAERPRPAPAGGPDMTLPDRSALRAMATSEVDVVLDVAGEERTLPAVVDDASERILRESLGEVGRHAGATVAKVAIRFVPGAVVLEVLDDGSPGPGADAASSLEGIVEAAAALGGGLLAGPPRDGRDGFRVQAWLPTEGQPA